MSASPQTQRYSILTFAIRPRHSPTLSFTSDCLTPQGGSTFRVPRVSQVVGRSKIYGKGENVTEDRLNSEVQVLQLSRRPYNVRSTLSVRPRCIRGGLQSGLYA